MMWGIGFFLGTVFVLTPGIAEADHHPIVPRNAPSFFCEGLLRGVKPPRELEGRVRTLWEGVKAEWIQRERLLREDGRAAYRASTRALTLTGAQYFEELLASILGASRFADRVYPESPMLELEEIGDQLGVQIPYFPADLEGVRDDHNLLRFARKAYEIAGVGVFWDPGAEVEETHFDPERNRIVLSADVFLLERELAKKEWDVLAEAISQSRTSVYYFALDTKYGAFMTAEEKAQVDAERAEPSYPGMMLPHMGLAGFDALTRRPWDQFRLDSLAGHTVMMAREAIRVLEGGTRAEKRRIAQLLTKNWSEYSTLRRTLLMYLESVGLAFRPALEVGRGPGYRVIPSGDKESGWLHYRSSPVDDWVLHLQGEEPGRVSPEGHDGDSPPEIRVYIYTDHLSRGLHRLLIVPLLSSTAVEAYTHLLLNDSITTRMAADFFLKHLVPRLRGLLGVTYDLSWKLRKVHEAARALKNASRSRQRSAAFDRKVERLLGALRQLEFGVPFYTPNVEEIVPVGTN